MSKLSVVVPVYYNEESLPYLFERLQAIDLELNKLNVELELIFVDDGSKDGSLQALLRIKEQRPQTKIIKLSRNFGAVVASKTGLQYASGDCALILAADLQDPPELITQMVSHWLDGQKLVICVRNKRHDGFVSEFFSRIYYFLLRRLVVSKYPSRGFDIMLVDRSILDILGQSSKNINLQLLAFWTGHEPTIIEYERPVRPYGVSRWSFTKRLTFLLDSLLGFSIIPVRVISFIGLVVSLSSFSYGILILLGGLFGNIPVAGFATLATLITFLLGLLIVMLGVIGEYIVRIFDQLNRRPESVIDEIY